MNADALEHEDTAQTAWSPTDGGSLASCEQLDKDTRGSADPNALAGKAFFIRQIDIKATVLHIYMYIVLILFSTCCIQYAEAAI